MIWIILTVLFSLSTLGLSYACFNMVKKIEVYEAWLDHFRTEINQMYGRLKAVDEKNLFEKDDDVGGTFADIVRICKEFNDKL